MSRPSRAVVVFLLLVASVAVAGAATQESTGAMPLSESAPGEPNYLAIAESEWAASNATTVDIDVGTAIAADSASLQATNTRLQFQRAYADATTDANRTRVLVETVERLENVTEDLKATNRAGIDEYASGDLSAAAFRRDRARIHSRAAELQATVSAIQSTFEDDRAYRAPDAVAGRLASVGGRLEVMQGPISATTAEQLASGGEGHSVYAEASDSGYTFAYVVEGLYVRETFLGSQWRPEQPDQFAENETNRVNAAENRAEALYPWVRDNKIGGSTWGLGQAGIYRFRAEFPNGQLTAYLDGGTRNVFRESQTRTVSSFNTTAVVNRTQGSVRLTVDRTFVTGPARIALRDPATGEPIDGTVTIGQREAVPVGEDGTLWIVEPRGDVRINATAGGSQFSVTLSGS